jgi:hypothetical protein
MRRRLKAVRPGRAFGYFWQDKSDPRPGAQDYPQVEWDVIRFA